MSTLLFRLSAAIMLGSVVLLAGCHRNQVKHEQSLAASMKGQFDLTLQSYKDGQFLLDGAVLSAIGHGRPMSPTCATRATCPRRCC
ncbi:hypothetical protein [Rhodanobacter lindaniclasticus]